MTDHENPFPESISEWLMNRIASALNIRNKAS